MAARGGLPGVFNIKSGLKIKPGLHTKPGLNSKIWDSAHRGHGPYGPGPIWARAHMGPGPFLVGRTPHQKTHPGKKSPNCVFCVFFGNKKDARRPYDHFPLSFAPRSLLCVRKRRFPFLKPRCFCAAKMLFWGNRLPEPGEPAADQGGTGRPPKTNRFL